MTFEKWHKAHYIKCGFISSTTELRLAWDAATAAERERAALVCDDEARIRTEAGNTHPEDSYLRGRCFPAARAAISCANGVRGGEVVGPNARGNAPDTAQRMHDE